MDRRHMTAPLPTAIMIDHVGFTVPDLSEAVGFFESLGFELLSKKVRTATRGTPYDGSSTLTQTRNTAWPWFGSAPRRRLSCSIPHRRGVRGAATKLGQLRWSPGSPGDGHR